MKGICNRLTADILSRERLELFSETMCNHGQLLYELSCHDNKRPNRKRIREMECLIWLMVLQESNLWFLGPMHLGRTSCQWEHLAMIIFGSWWAGSNGTSGRQGPGTRAGSLWLTFPVRPGLLKFLKLLKMVPLAGENFLICESLWETFYFQTVIWLLVCTLTTTVPPQFFILLLLFPLINVVQDS